jgi:2-haloacid dehalogenase
MTALTVLYSGAKSLAMHGRDCDGEAGTSIVRRAFGDRGEAMAGAKRDIVIFDLGGVLVEWDPRHLYRKLFAGDETAMEHFLANVCTHEWNRGQDAGRSFAEGARLLKADYPHLAELIDAYGARFDEMMPGPVAGSVEILAELRARGTPLYALTNFSAETYRPAFARFEFLKWFRGVIVSGEVRAIKPNPEIFHALLETHAVDPHRAVFIDDVPANVAAATGLGIHGIHFTTPEALRAELVALGLLA